VAGGSPADLAAAIGRGADLRVYTEFVFEEHIVPGGDGDPTHEGPIREVIDFRETILLHGPSGPHVAAVTTLRQALHPPFGFNGDPRMSYFLYQSDGRQACANVLFGEAPTAVRPGVRQEIPTPPDMPKMSPEVVYDIGTTGPSRNFAYDMETYRFFVRDEWEELLAHDADGRVERGSVDAIEGGQIAGRELKVGIRGLGDSLGDGPDHEVFTLVGSGFFHTRMRLYDALTHPLVRVAPAIPVEYRSFGWDVAWVFLRTDGVATVRRLDPYTRAFEDVPGRFACRWFAR
jgi:hypothetical protein